MGRKELKRKPGKRTIVPQAFKHPDFLKMKSIWYRKLKESGFKDLEEYGEFSDFVQKEESLHSKKAVYLLRYEADTLKHQFLDSHEFKCAEDKAIWTNYVNTGTISPLPKGINYDSGKYRQKKNMKAFRAWLKQECAKANEEPFKIDLVQLEREVELEERTRIAQSADAMAHTAEVWMGNRWRKARDE